MTTTRPPAADWGSTWGRVSARGSRNGRAATDETTAAEIRYLRDQGLQRDELALMFGLSLATITRITRGQTYRDPPPADRRGRRPGRRGLPAIVAAEPPAVAADRSGWGHRDR